MFERLYREENGKNIYSGNISYIFLSMTAIAIYTSWGFNRIFTPFIEIHGFNLSDAFSGLILGLEGLVGIFADPISGFLADRRFLYPHDTRGIMIVISVCVMAIMLCLIPYATSVDELIGLLIALYIAAHFMRTPYNSLMPRTFEVKNWGVASGYVNSFLAIGSLVAFLMVAGFETKLGIKNVALIEGLIVLVTGIITPLIVKEKKPESKSVVIREKRTLNERVLYMFRDRRILIYFAIQLFSWIAYESIAIYFVSYVQSAGYSFTSGSDGPLVFAAIGFAVFNAVTLIASIPIGIFYKRYKKKKNIMVYGLAILALVMLLAVFFRTEEVVIIYLAVGGLGWAAFLVAAYPIGAFLITTLEGDREAAMSSFFGLSAFFNNAALLIASVSVSFILTISHNNFEFMFLDSASAAIVSIILIFFMRLDNSILSEFGKDGVEEILPITS
ncbi:MFS transporter [Cuniculiplasma sp. SKW4]|uniref:MFS transporter n=1 Tax=Cuniculiplasma sp. SKW4 TaxID=3400171 RepID=UPI003FD419A8